MPDIQHTLQGNDLGFLKMVAGAWGIELNAPDAHTGLLLLVNAMLNRTLVNEIVEALPPAAAQALRALIETEGRMTWAVFTRRFGEVRAMGAGRRDRERPDLKPASPAEVLWYRALIGKTFLNLPPEPQEYAYIPDDLLELMNPIPSSQPEPLGRPASPGETAHPLPANDLILDRACSLLAALRSGLALPEQETQDWAPSAAQLTALLRSAGLIDTAGVPLPEPTRAFLEAPRAEALAWLVKKWMESPGFNELLLLPGLKFEGEWANNPLQTRSQVIEMLSHLPTDRWWSLNSFVSGVFEAHPDFQRPAGDYDSWFIRRESDGQYLCGIASWDEVDGALLRLIITGPMHWLGIYDLAAPEPGAAPAAFRPSAWAEALWHGSPPRGLALENQPVKAGSDGLIRLPALSPRSLRYQVARFCNWEGESREEYRYRLSPASLERARQQGLKTSHLVTLLRKHSSGPLPPTLLQALERWEKFGPQAQIETVTILRLSSAEILNSLRQSRAGRFLGEAVSPTVVIVKPGGEQVVLRTLAEMGYLGDIEQS